MNIRSKSILLLISFAIAGHYFLSGIEASDANLFKSLILISPVDGETNVSLPVVLTWNKLPQIDSYELQLLNSSKAEVHKIQVDISPKQFSGKESIDYFLEKENLNYHEIYYWRVKARISDRETIYSELWSFFTNENPWQIAGDDDDDGIPNSEEIRIHTDPSIKTLFIRPIKKIITPNGIEHIYWEEFISLFPDSRPGFAKITAFSDAGIEIVVIGCIGNSGTCKAYCHDYSPFDNFDYDPAPENLPCDILEITYEMETNELDEGINCAYYPKTINQVPVSGHTYFDLSTTLQNGVQVDVFVWSWDIKGYTPWGYQHHGYYMPQIFPFPLKNYFREGAYNQIKTGQIPNWTNCNQAYLAGLKCDCRSPMNINDNDPDPDPPYIYPPDETVEFNIVNYVIGGEIQTIIPNARKYKEEEVLRRTIVHEIGHALLGPSNGDWHCSNPDCIMFEYTLDWEEKGFGTASSLINQGNAGGYCEHSPGGSQDIRGSGIVHNNLHTN